MSSPLIAGNFSIASRMISGRMILATMADSIWNQPTFGMFMRNGLFEQGIMGFGGHLSSDTQCAAGHADTGQSSKAWTSATCDVTDMSPSPWMWKFSAINAGCEFTGTGTSSADSTDYVDQLTWCASYIGDSATNFAYRYQNWFDGLGLTGSACWLNNATDGFPSFRLRIRTEAGTALATTTGLSAAGTTSTFGTGTVSVGARAYSGVNGGPNLGIHGTASTNYTGKKLRLIGHKLMDTARLASGNGFMLCPMNRGSTSTNHWTDTAAWSQAARNAYFQFLGVDTLLIALGQNNGGTTTKAQYKADINTLIDMGLVSNPSMQFILLSQYQSDPSGWATTGRCEEFEDALYEIANERASIVLFLNMRGAMARGTASATDSHRILSATAFNAYITDGVHMTDPYGRTYYTNILWTLIMRAAMEDVRRYLTAGSFIYRRRRNV